MRNFLHWRKMTWVLALWPAALVTLLARTGGGHVLLVSGLWLAGAAVLAIVWFVFRPPYQQGRGFRHGFFMRPRPGNWRVLNLHRTF